MQKGEPRPRKAYFSSLEAAGGTPVLVHPAMAGGELEDLKARLAGIVLSGGGDVDPSLYREPRHPKTAGVSAERDALEVGLAVWAAERGVPLLAICRGIQVLNVALGGTLVQDIPSEPRKYLVHDSSGGRGDAVHPVKVEPGTVLAGALGGTGIDANSFHHQAIRAPGRGLKVVALAPDGIVEGVEMPGARAFLLAVQWHPEEMTPRDAPSVSLFRRFLSSCAGQAGPYSTPSVRPGQPSPARRFSGAGDEKGVSSKASCPHHTPP
jgi:putative glutamine amidotransferase